MKRFIIFAMLISLFTSNILFSQWISFSNGITESDYYFLYNANSKLYAANPFGLYYSTNEGIKWQKFSLNANLCLVMKKDSNLYTGGYDGLYISTNDGVNWLHPTVSGFYGVTCLANSDSLLFAGASYDGIYKSTNNGFNWIHVYPNTWRAITSLAVKDNYIFAGLKSGEYSMGEVIYSSNGGSNWMSTNLDSVSVTSLCIKDQNIFAGTETNGLYRSTNIGNSWVLINNSNIPIRLIKYIDSTLYISIAVPFPDSNGFYKSTDNGNTWQQINKPFSYNVVSVEKINNTFVMGMVYRGIFLSTDNGSNWKHYLHLNSTISSLFNYNSRLFAGVNNQGIYYSDDNGENWLLTKLKPINVYDFTSNGSALFIGTDRYNNTGDTGGVFISTDNGINWNITNLKSKIIYCISYINDKLYAGAAYEKIFTSSNNGINWIKLTNFPAAVPYCFYKKNSKIFVGAFRESYRISGMFFTTNEGISWDSIINISSIHKIADNSNFLFAASSNNLSGYYKGLYRSGNEGTTWDTTTLNIPIQDIITSGNYVFAIAGSNGIHLSSDNGNTWKIKNEGLTNNSIKELLVYNGYIFAGSYGYGIYRRTLQDITSVNNNMANIPNKFSLSQNYPNPFNPTTSISYKVASYKVIRLVVHNILGKEVTVLVNEKLHPGEYETSFDGSGLASGIYFYTLFADGERIDTKKMVLLK